MAVWYEVEKSEAGIYNFQECNWYFHDFCIDKIEYHRKPSIIEMFMKYDELKGSVMLRFIGVSAINISLPEYDDDAWLTGSTLVVTGESHFLWIASEDNSIDKMKEYATWIESERILWAVTDENGKPTELPPDKIDQIWQIWGKEERHHFTLKEFSGDNELIADLILR